MKNLNWKLINSVGIPVGLVTAFLFSRLSKIWGYIILLVMCSIAGLIVYYKTETSKKVSTSNTVAVIVLIVIAYNLLRRLF